MPFDFDAAVAAPFRMQPGLRRLADGAPQLTPVAPDSRHQREKLAVLSAFWPQALCTAPGFDPGPALDAVCAQATREHPQLWSWNGTAATALAQGLRVTREGDVDAFAHGGYGLGDEVANCLLALPPTWRLAALLSLSFAEDLAIVDARSGRVPWLAVALPSHWAPEVKVGRPFGEIHAPVADNALLLRAADSLLALVSGPQRWERFVWTVSDHPRLHAHPARIDPQRWSIGPMPPAWWRSEHQTFIPLPAHSQAVFTIRVEVEPLARAISTPQRAAQLHEAIASMSEAVLAYRGLTPVRDALLAWLAARRDAS